jgi:hypothetical protein
MWYDTDEPMLPAGGSGHGTAHNSGGSDPITALDAGVITTGTLVDARLSANVPLKNAANTFTPAQTFASDIVYTAVDAIIRPDTVDGADNKSMLLAGGGTAAGARGAYVWVRGNEYSYQPGSITLAPGTGGQTIVTGGINERGRTTPMGEWIDFTPTFYIDGGGAISVTSLVSAAYSLVGKTITVGVFLNLNLTVAGRIRMPIPGGFGVPAKYFIGTCLYTGASNGVAAILAHYSSPDFYIDKVWGTPSWPAGAYTLGFVFPFAIA